MISRTDHPNYDRDTAAPQYTAFTSQQAASEARTALAVCRLSSEDRADCEDTLSTLAAFHRARREGMGV